MGIESYSTTPASNNSASPNGFPEGMAPSGVNDSARQVMADIRSWYEDAEWVNFGDTITYVSATQFRVTTDLTSRYSVARRVKAVGSSTGTIYGIISASSFSSPNTTVTVVWDSGSLVSETLAISVGTLNPTNPSIDVAALAGLATLFGDGIDFDTGTKVASVTFPSSTQRQTYLSSATVSSAVGSVDSPTITAGNDLIIRGRNVKPVTDAVTLALRTSTDGATYDNGASDYYWMAKSNSSSGARFSSGNGASTLIALHNQLQGSGSAEEMNFSIRVENPRDALYTRVIGEINMVDSSATPARIEFAGGRYSTTAVTNVRLFYDAGNIASGDIEFWLEEHR